MARRAIVVVHGVGSQKKGETLNAVVEPFIRFLHRFGEPADPNGVQIVTDLRPVDGPARAILRFGHGGQVEEWCFTEAWWAEAFHANPADPVMRWGFRVLVEHAYSIIYGIFLRHLPFWSGPAAAESPEGPAPADPVYQNPDPAWSSRLWDVVVAASIAAIYLPAWLIVLALASLFYLIAQLPSWLLIVGPAAALQQSLVETLVSGVGDQQAMTADYLAVNSASRPILDALAPHLDPLHPDYQPCETVTVIAHSGGCVVSYNALSTPELKGWSFGDLAGPDLPARSAPRWVTWFTVGSGLNLAYQMAPHDWFWQRRLDPRIRWVNLWARYDPVPFGPVPVGLRDQVVRGGPAPADRFEDVRVVNRENPFADHGAYWRNYEEVVSRFVYEILGRPKPGHLLADAIDTCHTEIVRHRRGVALFVWLRFAALVLVLLADRGTQFSVGLGDWLLGLLALPVPWPWPLDHLVHGLAVNPVLLNLPGLGPVGANALIGLAGLGLLAYLVYRLATLWPRGWLERGSDWR